MTRRIRVFFINCPALATDAASFLILAQNRVQRSIQFEVHHFWIYADTLRGRLFSRILACLEVRLPTLGGWLWRRVRAWQELKAAPVFGQELQHYEWAAGARDALGRYDAWFEDSGYSIFDASHCSTIIVTQTPIWGEYLSMCEDGVGLVSTATWSIYFRPASALEYVLASVQRLSLRLIFGDGIGSHFPTRGCIWDFDVHQPDFRISAFLGFLCQTCSGALGAIASAREQDDVHKLLQNEWIGRTDDQLSIATLLVKNYKYELWRSTGLSPSIAFLIRQSFKDGLGKSLFDIAKWIFVGLAALFVASKFPEAFEILFSN